MCGIAGIVRFDGGPVPEPALRQMAVAMAHRGPDGEGFYVRDGVGFAHRRLAIIDPQGGHQPFVLRGPRLAITYNGEVYNFLELRKELGGNDFVTATDTEAVVRAYEKWGIGCLERLRGMFAFALHDAGRRRLYLVRDRFGIKPLYYSISGSHCVFASELGGMLASGLVRRDVDRAALADYLRYGYVPDPKSIYEDVRKLEPAHYVEIDLVSGAATMHRYWDLQSAEVAIKEKEALSALEATLAEILRLYVRSDVPFGAFLSGGIDSGLVTALMTRELRHAVRSYTIGFDVPAYSELPYALEASRALGTQHRQAVLSPEVALGLLPKLARHFGEPFGDSSALPTYYVSQLAAADVKMVLSGDGGDELFAGYWSYPLVQERATRRGAVRRAGFAVLAAMAGNSHVGRSAAWRARGWQALHHGHRDAFNAAERTNLLGNSALATEIETEFVDSDEGDPVKRCQLSDLRRYLPGDILTKVDRMSMANSLEVRVPLLDHRLVELAFTLPLNLRLRDNGEGGVTTKYLLRRAAARHLPAALVDRRKMGFGIPIEAWLRGPMRAMLSDLLSTSAERLGDFVAPHGVRQLVSRFLAGDSVSVAQIWTLLGLRLWLDEVHLAIPARSGSAILPEDKVVCG
jgi:asparagine synthase (glutamine-hydrolysing)